MRSYQSFLKFILLAGLWIQLGLSAAADLILVPTAGVVLMDNAPDGLDVAVKVRDQNNFQGRFYGQPVNQIWVIDNGNINLSGDTSYYQQGFHLAPSASTARIAPLWDDVLLFQPFPNRVIDHSVPGQYLAVTWENVLLFNDTFVVPLPVQTFQVLWFETATTIRGFDFLADDIAFGYRGSVPGTNSFGNLFATVGVTNGTGRFTPLPGDTPADGLPAGDGYIIASQSHLLAFGEDEFLLFRPMQDPSLGYISSRETFPVAIPEPSSAILMFLPLAVWLGRRYFPAAFSKSVT